MNTTWEKLWENFWHWISSFAGNALLAVGIFAIGWVLARLASKVTKQAISRGKLDSLVVSFIGSLVEVLVLVVAIISAIAQIGINITSLIAALGAAGLTASFALQGSLSNLVSGIQIIFTKPFRMGDYLSFGNYEGTVKRIEILYTVLSTLDNKEVIVPNSQVTGGVVVNFSRNGTRRLDLNYGISYTADIEKAKAVLHEVVEQESRILKIPAPLIAVGEWKESSVTLAAKVWCHHKDYWDLYFAMQEAVKLAFDREGITIPFPQMDVHLDR